LTHKKLIDAAAACVLAARTGVLARLVASSDVGGQEIEAEFVKHVLERYSERHALGIQYLHELMLQEGAGLARAAAGSDEKGRKGAGGQGALPARYSKVLNMMIDGLMQQGAGKGETAAADAQRLLTKLLAEAPAIDGGAMASVSKLCDDESKVLRQVGMSCLRALIVHHQAWRAECLRRLLRYTVAKDESIRSPAIRLVANKLFGLSYLFERIQVCTQRKQRQCRSAGLGGM
jgi:hypothetical protein